MTKETIGDPNDPSTWGLVPEEQEEGVLQEGNETTQKSEFTLETKEEADARVEQMAEQVTKQDETEQSDATQIEKNREELSASPNESSDEKILRLWEEGGKFIDYMNDINKQEEVAKKRFEDGEISEAEYIDIENRLNEDFQLKRKEADIGINELNELLKHASKDDQTPSPLVQSILQARINAGAGFSQRKSLFSEEHSKQILAHAKQMEGEIIQEPELSPQDKETISEVAKELSGENLDDLLDWFKANNSEEGKELIGNIENLQKNLAEVDSLPKEVTESVEGKEISKLFTEKIGNSVKKVFDYLSEIDKEDVLIVSASAGILAAIVPILGLHDLHGVISMLPDSVSHFLQKPELAGNPLWSIVSDGHVTMPSMDNYMHSVDVFSNVPDVTQGNPFASVSEAGDAINQASQIEYEQTMQRMASAFGNLAFVPPITAAAMSIGKAFGKIGKHFVGEKNN